MHKLKKRAAHKAAKGTARHAVNGAVAKVRRTPFRSGSLLAVGAAVGGAAGWLAGRSRTRTPSSAT